MNLFHRKYKAGIITKHMRTSFSISLAVIAGSLLLSSCKKTVVSNITTAPQAPTISSINGGAGSITLTWSPVADVSFYDIYWAADSTVTTTTGTLISGVTANPYTISGLADSTRYAFIITAVNPSGESSPSSVATTYTLPLPGAPTITKIVSGTGNVTVSWTSVSGATSYNLYWSADTTVNTNTANKISNATSPMMVSGLAAGTQYSFVVTGLENGKEGKTSKVARALTEPNSYLFAANSGTNNVSVFAIGDGGSLSALPTSPFTVGSNPNSVTSADINSDGKPDLIAANLKSNSVSVLLNTNGMDFASQASFMVGSGPVSVKAVDINNDGKPDLIVANSGTNTISVLMNTTPSGATTPTFDTQQTFTVGSNPVSLKLADINGDGRKDIVVANGNDTISILLNTTAPGASTAAFDNQQVITAGNGINQIAIADVNRDNKPDIITANQKGNNVSVLLNTTSVGSSTVTFAAEQQFMVGNSPVAVTTGDFNNDGKPDLAVANENDNSVSILLNTTATGNSTVSFTNQQVYDVNIQPVALTVSDVNGDGKSDLMVSNMGSNMVSVLLNQTNPGSTTPGFAGQQNFMTGSQPAGIVVAHFGSQGNTNKAVMTAEIVMNR